MGFRAENVSAYMVPPGSVDVAGKEVPCRMRRGNLRTGTQNVRLRICPRFMARRGTVA
jgi:hypothetical protein